MIASRGWPCPGGHPWFKQLTPVQKVTLLPRPGPSGLNLFSPDEDPDALSAAAQPQPAVRGIMGAPAAAELQKPWSSAMRR